MNRAVSLVMLAAACGAPVAPTGPDAGSPSAEWSPPPIAWGACEQDADATAPTGWDCGVLNVPADYEDPRVILALAVQRHRATDDASRVGVLFVNPDGPGSGAAPLGRDLVGKSSVISARFDVYAIDPRGTGASGPPVRACLDDYEFDQQRALATDDVEGQRAAAAKVRERCLGTIGAHTLTQLGTANAARDLETLRRLLGEERVNAVGVGAGAQLSALYATLFPARVRGFVLDSPTDGSWELADPATRRAASMQALLERFFGWCGTVPRCRLEGGKGAAAVRAAYRAALDDVAAGRVTTPRGPLPVGDVNAIVQYFLRTGDFGAIGSVLRDVKDNRGVQLLEYADGALGRRADGSYVSSRAPHAAFTCVDRAWGGLSETELGFVAAGLREASPDFGEGEANLYRACVGWPAPAAAPPAIDASAAPPMLVLATRHDPVTPLEFAAPFMRALGNGSFLVEHYGRGHGVMTRLPTILGRVERFLVEPGAGGDDRFYCLGEVPPPLASDATVRLETFYDTPFSFELRDMADDSVVGAGALSGSEPLELTVPAGRAAFRPVLRASRPGARPTREYDTGWVSGSRGFYVFILTDEDLASMFEGVDVEVTPEKGMLSVTARDCDGQSALGARVVISPDPGPGLTLVGDWPECAWSSSATEVSLCNNRTVPNVEPGTYEVGLEKDGRSLPFGSVIVEPRGSTYVQIAF